MPPSRMDRAAHWLHLHSWGWLVVLAVLALVSVGWLATPVTWRNGEGDVVSDGKRVATYLCWMRRLFFWGF